ncbi:hypothetical protein GDO81_019901 [Engystomops pustulosus]|uniref:Uncharacterized protein n=1 Tax=Engystomops pustulosus TaxID=76066 RepID=A0AAV6ZFD3_ENGPU|nr:hypothetical protein GDO81_019901 [Engystomops pustulosus]
MCRLPFTLLYSLHYICEAFFLYVSYFFFSACMHFVIYSHHSVVICCPPSTLPCTLHSLHGISLLLHVTLCSLCLVDFIHPMSSPTRHPLFALFCRLHPPHVFSYTSPSVRFVL